MKDITNAIISNLDSCRLCDITNNIIDSQSLSCNPEFPTHITYRARLEGTSSVDSGSLLSLIEEWVSSGPNIIMAGVLMRVNSECSVAISSLHDKECSANQPSTASESINSAAIIGGVVLAGIFIITIAVGIIAVAHIIKHRRENVSVNE